MRPADLHPDVDRVVLSAEDLQRRIAEMAAEIRRDYAGSDPHLVCVLRGAAVFAADLLRALGPGPTIDFVACASYSGARSEGQVRLVKDLEDPVAGRNVLLVEDIVDSGRTLVFLRELLEVRSAASIRTCALLDKPSARKVAVPCDYLGFTIPDWFVVGFGLDYNQQYRGLPYLATLRAEVVGRLETSLQQGESVA